MFHARVDRLDVAAKVRRSVGGEMPALEHTGDGGRHDVGKVLWTVREKTSMMRVGWCVR